MALTKILKFDDDVLGVLFGMTWNDTGTVGVIAGQLDRDLYVKTNKALVTMGGKWDRKVGGHIFSEDPRSKVEGLIHNGSLTVERDGFFETPPDVVHRMTQLVMPTGDILEPSAGIGAIADRLPIFKDHILCIEKNEQRANVLRGKGYIVQCCDFLEYTPSHTFDTIFMNPPFEEQQDILHVKHAYQLLASAGSLVSVMGEGAFFSTNQRAVSFRDWLESIGGYSEVLPAGSFKGSGAMSNARLVVIKNEERQ